MALVGYLPREKRYHVNAKKKQGIKFDVMRVNQPLAI